MERNLGTVLIASGVVLLIGAVTGSAALAPDPKAGMAGSNETLVSSQGINTPGDIRLLNGSAPRWVHDAAPSYFEVERLKNGRVIAAYVVEGADDCGPYTPPCARTGYRVVEPGPEPAIVSEWSFPVRTAKDSELHAVEPLPDGAIAVADMEHERVAVVRNGSVVWQWNASSFYEAPPDPTLVDWLHINDLQTISGGRMLVSVRNANQLLVLKRGNGVVEVINADRGTDGDSTCRREGELVDRNGDGDVRCGDPAVLSHQHNPHWLGNGAVLVADSENDRIVELHRGPAGSWKPAWLLTAAGGIEFYWPRDADRLPNGNTLITDSLNQRVVEVDQNGTLAWSTTVPSAPYEADRLPIGETGSVPFAPGTGKVRTEARSEVPVLSTVVLALHTTFPWLPFWIGEWQVALMLLALALLMAGVVIKWWK